MEEDLEDINNLSNLWVDYESDLSIYLYIYWKKENTKNLENSMLEFLIRYKLITDKYCLAQFFNSNQNIIFEEIEVDIDYEKYPYYKVEKNIWLKSNNLYSYDFLKYMYSSLIFVKEEGVIKSEELVSIDPTLSKKSFISNDINKGLNPPIKIGFYAYPSEDKNSCMLKISSDCFLPYLDNKKTRRMENSDVLYTLNGIDATELAYLNAPRLNSFIRDWRDLCFEYGATNIEFETPWYGFTKEGEKFLHTCTEDGVLFNDEIVYYEDVYDLLPDEHRVKNFEKIQYDIDKSFYEDFLKKQNIKL